MARRARGSPGLRLGGAVGSRPDDHSVAPFVGVPGALAGPRVMMRKRALLPA